jgi:predicted DCC family thiol-disulfide oxidoreductase YuxK
MSEYLPEIKNNTIFYDGSCPFCFSWVRIIRFIDRKYILNFCTLQSSEAASLLKEHNAIPSDETVLFINNGQLFEKSDAVLKIISLIGFPVNVLLVFKLISRKNRDKLYDFVARNRFRLSGKNNYCEIPDKVSKPLD